MSVLGSTTFGAHLIYFTETFRTKANLLSSIIFFFSSDISYHTDLQHFISLISTTSYKTMADSSNGIPIMRKPSDAMSNGLNSNNLAASAMARHPIDRMQRGEYII